MNIFLRSLTKRTLFQKKLFFSPRYLKSSNIDDPEADLDIEVIDPDQIDEESFHKKIQKTYVFADKSLALPLEFPLFPFSKFSVSLGENRAKVFSSNF